MQGVDCCRSFRFLCYQAMYLSNDDDANNADADDSVGDLDLAGCRKRGAPNCSRLGAGKDTNAPLYDVFFFPCSQRNFPLVPIDLDN